MHLPILSTLLLGGSSLASRLYTASYDGKLTQLQLSHAYNHDSEPVLTKVAETNECGASPSWLMLDEEYDILYCLDEGVDLPKGGITSFEKNDDGSLTKVERRETITGPVSSAFYSPLNASHLQFFAVAHYAGSALTTYAVDRTTGHFNHSQTFNFTMSGPGPDASRQDAPHPHGVFVDPTGRFIIVPDLGADLLRIFHVHPTSGSLKQQEPSTMAPGSGPRHAVFWTPDHAPSARTQQSITRFYLVSELDNTLKAYDVSYAPNGTINFSQFYEENTFGGETFPSEAKAGEIGLSPDNSNILISNRLDNTFGTENGSNTDSLAIFRLPDKNSDEVSFDGLYPSFGPSARHFSFSPGGDLLALALQNKKVVISDWEQGRPEPLLAEIELGGEVTAVVWDL
ncbi:Lactonase, 7-bladed beta-propeller-domain-containing protein [Aspergillus filifer]